MTGPQRIDDDLVDRAAERTSFSGVVRADRGADVELCRAYGLADRARGIPMTVDTQLAMASGSKTFTALAVLRLVEDGVLTLTTPARALLGGDLPLVADDVTVEHLLSHRSGIGDYLDEGSGLSLSDYLMPVGVQHLATTEQYLPILDGHSTAFASGERFAYCNGGYVVLALIAERAAGRPFHDLVTDGVLAPAGMRDTAYLRADELPGRAALGYVLMDGSWRTNVFHLPVRGSGDGGCWTTVADLARFWAALFAGRIVAPATLAEMVRPRSDVPAEGKRYGLGLWLAASGSVVMMEGCDSGVSLFSEHDPAAGTTRTVIATTADGAWPVVAALQAAGAAVSG